MRGDAADMKEWSGSKPYLLAIAALVAAKLAIHMATNGAYDFMRDELYYLAAARHPAWGYVDYPPITPTVARLSLWLFGPSVWGLRLWTSIAGAVVLLLTVAIARELGGGRLAGLLAGVAALASPLLLGANWLFETVSFDQLTWAVCILLFARLIRRPAPWTWLALGVALGVGLETKYQVIGLALGLLAGLAATPLRRQLLTAWPWSAVALAALIFLPNLLWQIEHGWPSVQYTLNHHATQTGDFNPLSYLAGQVALVGPLGLPLWLAGWYLLWRHSELRPLAVGATVTFVLFLLVGKNYYVGGLYALLLAAGAVAAERVAARRRWVPATAAILAVLNGLILLPAALPLLPEPVMARSPLALARSDFGATIGWHELVDQVASADAGLSPDERSHVAILTVNYGEAGAIDPFGPAKGLPPAISPELTYWYWKPSHVDDSAVIAVGFSRGALTPLFGNVQAAGTLGNKYGLHNDEYGLPVFVCRNPRVSIDAAWASLREFN